jgi:phosphoserine phosphatase
VVSKTRSITASAPVGAEADRVPLCVDLDGTLLKTDLLWESLLRLAKSEPLRALSAPFWFLKGRAHLKREIARRVKLDPAALPYSKSFVEFLRAQKAAGRKIILATASDKELAEPVADYVGLFSEVLASDGETNLRGSNKLRALEERFGPRGFDYAGNSSPDVAVWEHARQAIVVNGSRFLIRRARQVTEVKQVFNSTKPFVESVFRELRPQRWLKNLIVLVPLIASDQVREPSLLLKSLLVFTAFSLFASGVYVLDDLLDLERDRYHPTKRFRPFAAGDLPLPIGFGLIIALLAGSISLAAAFFANVLAALGVYFALATSYSGKIKQKPLLDVFFLTGLYTTRLVAGYEATRIPYSNWLLIFWMLICVSFAVVRLFRESAAQQQKRDD